MIYPTSLFDLREMLCLLMEIKKYVIENIIFW